MSSDVNRAFWDERVPIHTASEFYDVEAFKAGEQTLAPFEVEELGDVTGRTLVHLQCHFGLDTLSWARLGARVTGLDFSAPAVEAAHRLATEIEVEAEFVAGDVYDAVEALGGRRFDVVYTGGGALNWLPDLPRWAGVVRDVIEPGGVLYLSEFHPFQWVFGDEDLTVEHDYFHRRLDLHDCGGTYADPGAKTEHNRTEEWSHALADVVSAVIDAGLVLEQLREHEVMSFERWPFLVKSGRRMWRMPEGRPRLPLMYSLRARSS
jgi:SAM-dependent methyltransferase